MSSTAQVLANRENSQKSTGPRTPEGKLITSRNGISHGLTSAGDPVLPHEDRNAFNALLKSYKSDFHPATEHENFLVTEMVGARWRLERAGRIECVMLEDIIDSDASTTTPQIQMAKAMMQKGGDPFARMDRHRTNLERTYHRCARELRASKKFEKEQSANKLAQGAARQTPLDCSLFLSSQSKANPTAARAQNDERTATNDARKASASDPISLR
jgi:hypothetical protein